MLSSIDELLKPRYKVIADYPQPPFTNDLYNVGNEHIFIEGDLLIQSTVNGALTFRRYGRLGHMSVGVPCCAHPEKFPKIFKKLQWWEDRKLHEMPRYVKCIATPDQKIIPGDVFKLAWIEPGWGTDHVHTIFLYTNCYIPATESEYNTYTNK
jgi:hypothetical protein